MSQLHLALPEHMWEVSRSALVLVMLRTVDRPSIHTQLASGKPILPSSVATEAVTTSRIILAIVSLTMFPLHLVHTSVVEFTAIYHNLLSTSFPHYTVRFSNSGIVVTTIRQACNRIGRGLGSKKYIFGFKRRL